LRPSLGPGAIDNHRHAATTSAIYTGNCYAPTSIDSIANIAAIDI
jgi:hypothetical protein